MPRIKPYNTNQESWNSILQKNLRIPMNQRNYSWKEDQIKKFMNDIFDIYDEDKYVEKMGSIINLQHNDDNYIYDGQQRTTTIILVLNALGSISSKLKNKVMQLLAIDKDLDTLSEEQKKIQKKYNADILPKIHCINPFDMEGLVNIFNNKVKPWRHYLSNEVSFVCNCGEIMDSKSDFIKHIKKKHNYSIPSTDTKIYDAYNEIYDSLITKNYDETQYINLFKFILNDIDVQYYDCTDPDYVSRIFDWENNRGIPVKPLDIVKNRILVNISDNKKLEIYEKWEELKNRDNKKIFNDFGETIFETAIQIMNNEINRKVNIDQLFKFIIKSGNKTYIEIQKFFDIVENLFEIVEKISEDKFGRLICNNISFRLNVEAYKWCMLPIFYKINFIDKNLINLFVRHYIRNIQQGLRGFNKLEYSNEFIRVTNEVLKNNRIDYYDEIKNCLIKNKEPAILDDNYIKSINNMSFKTINAKYVLTFLETHINTDLQQVSLDYTLEHIYPQKFKDKLKNKALIDNIGNLTLYEGKNSDNGHKGNSALGSKSFKEKMVSYNGSSCKITRLISEKYNTFSEETIIQRNNQIANMLNKYTKYF